MTEEPLRIPNGKVLHLVPICRDYPGWLENAKITINTVVKQTSGNLQRRGVGFDDPHSLLAIKESDLGKTVFLFDALYWLKPQELRKDMETARAIFEHFIDFTRNIAGGAGLIVGDAHILEMVAAISDNTWPPKESGGCSLICVKINVGDLVTSVERILDPSADPQRRLSLVFKS